MGLSLLSWALPTQAQARLYDPAKDGQCLTLVQARDAWPSAHLYYRPKASGRAAEKCWHAPIKEQLKHKTAIKVTAKPQPPEVHKPIPPGLSPEDFDTYTYICGRECALQLDFEERWKQFTGAKGKP